MFKKPEITKEEQYREKAVKLVERSTHTLEGITSDHKIVFDMLWNDEDPQILLDAMGNEAYKLFVVSHATQEFIKSIDENYARLNPPYEFTINEDGTVTLGDKIPEPVVEIIIEDEELLDEVIVD